MPTKKTKRLKPATPADAEIAMRLYDLRRESEMRKARNFVNFEFWPRSFEEFDAVASSMDSQQNAYLRQVQSYWEMAASLVLRGTFHPGVFLDWCGEAFFTYAKFKPLLKEIRAKMICTEASESERNTAVRCCSAARVSSESRYRRALSRALAACRV